MIARKARFARAIIILNRMLTGLLPREVCMRILSWNGKLLPGAVAQLSLSAALFQTKAMAWLCKWGFFPVEVAVADM